MKEIKEEILHIFVVGFHHKKGCQVEYSYPKLDKLPESWKNLTSLAMPDGAHNYDSDAVFFHLPSLLDPPTTIYGLSCFQQIPIEKVKNRTSDMTRGTVQKAVCLLSTVPLYGYLQVKMELVTAAFFDKGDFSLVSILEDAYHHLNDCLPGSIPQHLYDGLSVRDLVVWFRHRSLLLFKLLLLEQRVVFFHSPVAPLCSTILSLLSLHPHLIEHGLSRSSSTSCQPHEDEHSAPKTGGFSNRNIGKTGNQSDEPATYCDKVDSTKTDLLTDINSVQSNGSIDVEKELSVITVDESKQDRSQVVEEGADLTVDEDYFACEMHDSAHNGGAILQRHNSSETVRSECDVTHIANLDLSGCGLPLPLFTDGNLCLPYLSISYLDYINSPAVRGYVVGATNVLFKQKRQMEDVLVEIQQCRIGIPNPELRKQLTLSTEDLRFAEQLVRGTMQPRDSDQGTETWIRAQFTLYLLSLLRTSLLPDESRELENFNIDFMTAWKNTLSYNMWLSGEHSVIWELNPGHPCSGNLSVADMRLRLSQAMSSSESGRKLNQAVTTTGRAVGGALSQAKGALSSWWGNLTTVDNTKATKMENI